MGMPQEKETIKLPKVHANTGRSRAKTRDRYLDDDRREIARETWEEFIEMCQEALRSATNGH